jgi:DNA topoisomerase I
VRTEAEATGARPAGREPGAIGVQASAMEDETADVAVEPNGEHEQIAAAVGLAYLPADRPGLQRRRCGSGFTYLDARGRRVPTAERRRIRELAIPPAWRDVWIAPEPDAHLVATGIDDRGRKQYLYHPAWREAADTAKFERLASFGLPLGRLRRQVAQDLSGRGSGWACAAVVRLIDSSLIRPGSMRLWRENGSVGATTLTPENLTVTRGVVRLEFPGKGAVDQDIEVRDPLLARRISDLLDRTADGEPIFSDEHGRGVDAGQLNEYIGRYAGPEFSAKDLRTWGATCLVADRLVGSEAKAGLAVVEGVDTERTEAAARDAIEDAAAQLGNTAAVCRSSYVAPAVLDAYRSGALIAAWRRSRPATWLSRVEQAVRRVLVW